MKENPLAFTPAVVSALLILAPIARSATIDWDDGGNPDEDWATALNWAGDNLPTAADNARIGSFGTVITTSGIVFKDLFLGDRFDGFGGTATLTMSGGNVVAENIRLGTDNSNTLTGGNGTFNFLSGTVTLAELSNDVQCVEIGRGPNGVGLMVMGDGTSTPILNYGNGRFDLGTTGSATSTFSFKSGTVNGTDNLILGQGNGAGVATMTVGGFTSPATFTTTTDLNLANQNASLTINSNGTVTHRDLNFGNIAGRTTTINVNTGGILNSGGYYKDRLGNSVLNISGGTINFLAAAPSNRDVEQLTIADASTLSFTLGSLATPLFPLSVAGGGTKSASLTGTITFDTTPGTTDNSATVDTWNAGSATWDTITPVQTQWDLGASPDRLAGGIVAKVIDSPSVAITGAPTIVAPGWTPTVNSNDITLTSLAGGVAISPRSAVFNDSAADVLAGASAGDDLVIGLGAANASVLTLTDINAFDVTDDLVIGGTGQGTVTIGTIGGTATGNMEVTIGDDIVFGNGGTEGGTLNLYEGTLTVGGTIIEGTDDPDVQDAAVNNAQLHIDGGTLTVTGNAIAVQRFAIAQTAGTTGSYSQTGGTISHSGTASLGVKGAGDLTVTGVTLAGGNIILAETGSGSSTLTMTDSSWTASGTFEGAKIGNSDIILNGTSSIVQTADDFRIADGGTGTLTLNDNSSITHSGGNFETAELGTSNGTLNMNTTGSLTCLDNNFILGQSNGSVMALNLINGTIDMLPSGAASANGHMNCNGGVATVTMSGGSILIGEDLLGASTATGVLRWNQSAGQVLVNDTLDFRDNGDDRIALSGTAVMKLGQETGRNGDLDISRASTVGVGVGGNWLTLRGSGVTFEMINGLTSNLVADTDSTFNWEFDDTGLSTIKVGGTVTLNSAFANFTHVGTTPPSTGTFTLIDNQGGSAVVGEFTGLGEGAVVNVSGQNYQLSYLGGDGNDVTLTAAGASNAFDSWVLANYPGLTGGFDGDMDLDGVLSGLEWYFYNSDPTADSAFGAALSDVTATGSGSYTFTHPRPVDRTGLTETYQWSTDLQTFYGSGVSDGSTTVTLTPGAPVPAMTGYESVTVTVTATGTIPIKLFSNLKLSN